jgi:hypothetical protein
VFVQAKEKSMTGLFDDRRRDILNDVLLVASVVFFGAAAIAVIRYGIKAAV